MKGHLLRSRWEFSEHSARHSPLLALCTQPSGEKQPVVASDEPVGLPAHRDRGALFERIALTLREVASQR